MRGDKMVSYMANTTAVMENRKDAGCDTDTITKFMEFMAHRDLEKMETIGKSQMPSAGRCSQKGTAD